MLKSFQDHIAKEFPELKETPFIIAISGGVDSVVLAHLCQLSQFNFALAHCNFKLRGTQSDEDANFVEYLAKSLNCKVFIKEFETEQIATEEKNSIQITARDLRYNWFHELILTTEHEYLVTAHHLNDSLETFIINLSRSTGIKGLTGIPTKNDYIRRPLLKFIRSQIEEFALQKDLQWREDESNASTKYLRNKIRHHIVPNLLELNSSFLSNFDSTLEKLKETEELVSEFVTQISSEIITDNGNDKIIDILKLRSYKNQKAILYQLLSEYGFSEWDDVYNLLDAQTGKQVESSTHLLVKDRDQLVLSPIEKEDFEPIIIANGQKEIHTKNFKLKLETVNELGTFSSKLAYFDKSNLKFPLTLRSVEAGDYFYPFGMKGKKKLSDFLKDEKISTHNKRSQLVLCNANDDIIWVLNLRSDERYKVKPRTEDILKIEIIND